MASWNRTPGVLAIVAATAGCDPAGKALASEHLALRETESLAAGALRLQHAEHRGACLGLFDVLPERAPVLSAAGALLPALRPRLERASAGEVRG